MKAVYSESMKIQLGSSHHAKNVQVGVKLQTIFYCIHLFLVVHPGETALAFYTATNKTQHPIVGVSTYSIEPYIVGPHFNKIQCFCFEEQILYPGETVDMPVFFFIDPDISDDPDNIGTSNITLAYNFHKVSMENMPALPGFENIQLQKAESLIKL